MAAELASVALGRAPGGATDDLAGIVTGACAGQGGSSVPAALYVRECWQAAVRRQLLGAVVSRGQLVSVCIGSRRIGLEIVDAAPASGPSNGHACAAAGGVVCPETRFEYSRHCAGGKQPPAPAGYEDVTRALAREVQDYFDSGDLFQHLRVQPLQTVCVNGVSGVGKSTVIARALGLLSYPIVKGDLGEIVACASGADIADDYVAMALADLVARARVAAPSVVVLDNVDILCDGEQTDGIADLPRHVVEFTERIPPGVFLVLESSADGTGLPPSVRRCEALQHGLLVPVPRLPQREAIVRSTIRELLALPAEATALTAGMRETAAKEVVVDEAAIDSLVGRVANATAGYIAREIVGVCRQAFLRRLRDLPGEVRGGSDDDLVQGLQQLSLAESAAATRAHDARTGPLPAPPDWAHFAASLQIVRPSQQLEFEGARPAMRWADIGGYVRIKQELQHFIRLATSETPSRLGIRPPSGILLHGPSGCGKTAMALAMIGESACNVITIRGSELFSKYLGETEARLRRLFQAARAAAPCIVFMDEVDSIAARREWSSTESGSPALRVLSTLLNEMDGVHESSGVVAVACTNQLDKIDDAILRPGRFDRLVEIPRPSADDRRGILRVLAQRAPLAGDVCADALAETTDGFSGAGLERLFREAGLAAMRASPAAVALTMRDFACALAVMQSSRQ
ncbi:hypothetical protein LPJ61_001709 [Coemansia biformis]|uniref:AAA+ ATPase domain-containing protein n=1 Tax=Coemansia biformis TaxID=1286918 RepID=A0A9W8CZB9_9FUNG|nr:hypothetical protein LPJ61_001709 [Coemansia biformis]